MTEEYIHFIGIGGISMSGIAMAVLDKGYQVSGSDLKGSEQIELLRKRGARVNIGHGPGNITAGRKPDLVVISNAIPDSNSELKKAVELDIPIYKRAEMIAQLMLEKKGIAISGTHGKTTTTGLVSAVLKEGEFDPTVMIGGDLPSIGGNIQMGDGDYFVTEADESDGSLLYFDPYISIVTNIELDHINFYDSREKLLKTFKKFIKKPLPAGKSVVCAEDNTIREIIDLDDPNIISYGFYHGDIRASNINMLPFGSFFDIEYNGNKLGEINLQIPGRYNILNTLAAVAVGMYSGMSFTDIKSGVEKFNGVNRRFEKKGLIGDILIIDDYAHHPTEIKETLKAAANTGYERVIAIFQPHRYTRTRYLFDDFSRAFPSVDHLIITDIYSADEKTIKKDDKVLAEKLAAKCAKIYNFNVDYIKEIADIAPYLANIVKSRDLIITIGAGDVYKIGESLVEIMKQKCEMA